MSRDARTLLLGAGMTILFIGLANASIVIIGTDLPSWLPTFGLGDDGDQFYANALATLGLLGALAVAVGAGRREQQRRGVESDREFATALGAGGAAVIGLVLVLLAVTPGPSFGGNLSFLVLSVLVALITVPLVVVVATMAGVALARFDTEGDETDAVASQAWSLWAPLLTAVVAGLTVGFQSGMDLLRATGDGFGFPGWAPEFGTMGQTAVVYSQGFTAVAGLLVVVGGVGIGVLAARRDGNDVAPRRFVPLVAIGSGIGVTAAWLLVRWFEQPSMTADPVVLSVLSLVNSYVGVGLVVTLGAVAGLSHRRHGPETDPGARERSDLGPDAGSTPETETDARTQGDETKPADASGSL